MTMQDQVGRALLGEMERLTGQRPEHREPNGFIEAMAERALVTQEATSRQEPLPEDARLTEIREALAAGDTGSVEQVAALLAFAEERLRVNRGLLASAKMPEPTTTAQTDLADATDGELLQVCFDRGLITVSAT